MKKAFFLLITTLVLVACQPPAADPARTTPALTTPAHLTGRSVLVYRNRQYQDSYEVTEYNAAGVPLRAKASVHAGVVDGVSPVGIYTSTIQLEYDALLRLKKSVQVFDQLGYASCCGSVLFDPNRQNVHEYEYQSTTKNITREVSYSINLKTGERGATNETTRRFTDRGQLTQERLGSLLMYAATYDAQDQPLSETIYPARPTDRAAFTRRWANEYDANNRLLSRKINGSTSFESNTYDARGRLVRRVSNLYETTNWTPTHQGVYRLTVTDQVSDNLIDYRFRKANERWAMDFTYVNGQFRPDDIRVTTYAYEGDQTTATSMTYQLWDELTAIHQPGFDPDQIPKEVLRAIKEKKAVFNNQGKLLHEAFRYSYISERQQPQQLDATYASEYRYSYDEGGSLTWMQGSSVSPADKAMAYPTPLVEARYKRF